MPVAFLPCSDQVGGMPAERRWANEGRGGSLSLVLARLRRGEKGFLRGADPVVTQGASTLPSMMAQGAPSLPSRDGGVAPPSSCVAVFSLPLPTRMEASTAANPTRRIQLLHDRSSDEDLARSGGRWPDLVPAATDPANVGLKLWGHTWGTLR